MAKREQVFAGSYESYTLSDSGEMKASEVETHAQLLEFLQEKYGSVEELRVTALLEMGRRTTVPHRYRLSDGREIEIDIEFTEVGERILHPTFDLENLPD